MIMGEVPLYRQIAWHGREAAPLVLSADVHRGYSKARTRTALGPYGRSIPRSIGPS